MRSATLRISIEPARSRPRLRATGPRAWAVVLALALVLPAGRSEAQPDGCVQPSVEGCPVELGETVTSVLADPGQVDAWRLTVSTAGDLRVALTNLPEDYDLHLYTQSGAAVVESLNEGTADDVVQVQGAEAGEYLVYVNSPRGGTSSAPYTLVAQFTATAPRVVASSSPGRVLSSDDFSDPARGLFLNHQRGTSRLDLGSGAMHSFEWDYSYAGGALIGHVRGPLPQPGFFFGQGVEPADSRMLGDFAVEARARATRSPGEAEYAVAYYPTPSSAYRFLVTPGVQRYRVHWLQENRNLTSGRSAAVNQGSEENLLRMEVRGDTLRGFINGQEVDRVQHAGLAVRGGVVRIGFYAISGGLLADGDVEVRFTEFKVYVLDQ